MYHQLTRTHTVLTGGNAPKLLQSPCRDTKYRLRAFHCLNAFPLRQNCFSPDGFGFSSDFCFLSRRCVLTHQGEKNKTFRTPCKAQRAGLHGKGRRRERSAAFAAWRKRHGANFFWRVRRVRSCQLMVSTDDINISPGGGFDNQIVLFFLHKAVI